MLISTSKLMSPTVIYLFIFFLTWSTFVGYKHLSTPSPTKMAFYWVVKCWVLFYGHSLVLFYQWVFWTVLQTSPRQLTKHAAAAAKSMCQQVQVRGELEMEVCCTLLLWCAKDVAEKKWRPSHQNSEWKCASFLSAGRHCRTLSSKIFFSFLFGGLFPSALRGGLRLTGRGPAPRELAAGWRGLFLSGGWNTGPSVTLTELTAIQAERRSSCQQSKGFFIEGRPVIREGRSSLSAPLGDTPGTTSPCLSKALLNPAHWSRAQRHHGRPSPSRSLNPLQ